MKASGDPRDPWNPRDPRYPWDHRYLWDARESKKEEGIIDGEADIVRFAASARVNSEAEAKDRVDEEVSANIRARMEAKVDEADTEIRAGEKAKKAMIWTMIFQIACLRRVSRSTYDWVDPF